MSHARDGHVIDVDLDRVPDTTEQPDSDPADQDHDQPEPAASRDW